MRGGRGRDDVLIASGWFPPPPMTIRDARYVRMPLDPVRHGEGGTAAWPGDRRPLFTVADDFVVDVYHNGVKVPDAKRTLLHEVFGATAERIDIEVRRGRLARLQRGQQPPPLGRRLVLRRHRPGRRWRGLHDRTGQRAVVLLRRHGEGVRVHRRPGLPRGEPGPADREPLGRGRQPDAPGRGRVGRASRSGGERRNTWIKFVARP